MKDIFEQIVFPPKSLRRASILARKKREGGHLGQKFRDAYDFLKVTGQEKHLKALVVGTIFAGVLGVSICIKQKIYCLIPSIILAGACSPRVLASVCLSKAKSVVDDELEAAISLVSLAYIRIGDFIAAVKECISQLKEPIQFLFEDFLFQVERENQRIENALELMGNRAANTYFSEWCKQVAICQSDHCFVDTLPLIVQSMSNHRLIQKDMKGGISAKLWEFYTLLAISFLCVPFLKIINKRWFEIIVFTKLGNVIWGLGIFAVVCAWVKLNRIMENYRCY